jgi:thymidylate synthase (FAD)
LKKQSEQDGQHRVDHGHVKNPVRVGTLSDLAKNVTVWASGHLKETNYKISMSNGFARLVAHMGSDADVVQAARVSYGTGTKSVSDDRGLIRFLMRHRHTTPFEMVEFKFHIRAPIFVARQWLRHRTASVNEMSTRYSVVDTGYFLPDNLREQGRTNKQCSGGVLDGDEFLLLKQKASCDMAFHTYDELLRKGCSRELARIHLPQSTYTEFYWKVNLHNLLHFLKLRMHEHAQKEIRGLAQQVADLVRPIVPVTWEAFEDFELGAVTLSRLEVDALRTGGTYELDARATKGEQNEFKEKIKLLINAGTSGEPVV